MECELAREEALLFLNNPLSVGVKVRPREADGAQTKIRRVSNASLPEGTCWDRETFERRSEVLEWYTKAQREKRVAASRANANDRRRGSCEHPARATLLRSLEKLLKEPTFQLSHPALQPDSPPPTPDREQPAGPQVYPQTLDQRSNGKCHRQSSVPDGERFQPCQRRRKDQRRRGLERGYKSGKGRHHAHEKQEASAISSEEGCGWEQPGGRHSDWDEQLDAAYSRLDTVFSRNSQVVFYLDSAPAEAGSRLTTPQRCLLASACLADVDDLHLCLSARGVGSEHGLSARGVGSEHGPSLPPWTRINGLVLQ